MMVQVKEIEVIRLEGPVDYCDKPCYFKKYSEANRHLQIMNSSYPKLGYDKHRFVVTFEDGFTYEGRIDMKHPDNEYYSSEPQRINDSMREFLEFHSTKEIPGLSADFMAESRRILETYDLSDN